jgi:uncharacterized phage protein gp47/JayE
LRQVREIVRDDITAAVKGVSMVGNSVLRVMSDANAGLAHLTLRYIDWAARQFLPDTAETEWLDRHGDIWLTNADNSVGRKSAEFARGTVNFTGSSGAVVPIGTRLNSGNAELSYETTESVVIGDTATPCGVIALYGGKDGNLDEGETLSFDTTIAGVDGSAIVVVLEGGTDEEIDDDLRTRVLLRIREPPMGGDKTDYVQWTLSVDGVTRAWSYPLEMGMGTVTVRFMMDDLRAGDDGFPTEEDVARVAAYLDTVRPVAVKDFFCERPVPLPLDMTIVGLVTDNEAVRSAISEAIKDMLVERAEPGLTIYRSWVDEAISGVVGEDHHELFFATTQMPAPGYLAVLGTITWGTE